MTSGSPLPSTSVPPRDAAPIVSALAAGLFPNAAVLVGHDAEGNGCAEYRLVRPTLPPAPRLRIHASSVLARAAPETVLFGSAALGDGGWYELSDVLAVPRHVLLAAAPHFYRTAGSSRTQEGGG